jgi:hypothetical protein
MTEDKTFQSDFKTQKLFVDSLKTEWKQMWNERLDDKPKAEGVSMDNYKNLGVERGTIIHATRDFKVLNFSDILQQHKIKQPQRYLQPNPSMGGWSKFIKKEITSPLNDNKLTAKQNTTKKKNHQQQSKSSGWLHKN